MNTKEELLNNPIVKEIAIEFAKDSYNKHNTDLSFTKRCEVNAEEFFAIKKELEWKILAFKHKHTEPKEKAIYRRDEDSNIFAREHEPNHHTNGFQNYFLKNDHFEIYQVKYNNTIFTTGDSVQYQISDNAPTWKIDNFFIRQDGVMLVRSGMENSAHVEDITTIEKVEQRDWKIISFKEVDGGSIRTLNKDNLYSTTKEGGYAAKDMLYDGNCVKSGHLIIHSVQYKDQVFTIGDRFKLKEGCNISFGTEIQPLHTILGFIYNEREKGIEVVIAKDLSILHPFEFMEKIEPLFITNGDNEKIYERDKFYLVNKDSFILDTTTTDQSNYDSINSGWNFIVFKSKEKAEEWILYNKPSLSLGKILSIIQSNCVSGSNPLDVYNAIEKAVKIENNS